MIINDRHVQVELYKPIVPFPRPLLMLLHGSAGAYTRDNSTSPSYDNFGERTFARYCYVVVLPHYLEAVDMQSVTSREKMTDLFPVFLATVRGIFEAERSQPFVSDNSGSLYGESLGGFLAIALATSDSHVSALSVYGAGLPAGTVFTVKNRPPVLVQQGRLDQTVPPSNAEKLRDYLRTQGCDVTYVLYPEEMHMFSPKGQATLLQTTLAFFDQSLKR